MLVSHNAIRREASSATHICLSCRLKAQNTTRTSRSIDRGVASQSADKAARSIRSSRRRDDGVRLQEPARSSRLHDARGGAFQRAIAGARSYHSSSRNRQHAEAVAAQDVPGLPSPGVNSRDHTFFKTGGIRDQLRQWQELHGKDLDAQFKLLEQQNDPATETASNNLTRLPDPSESLKAQAEMEEEEQRAIAYFSRTPELDDGSTLDNRFLKVGDLIELEFPNSERESIIAVFVRRIVLGSQVFTMHGRWMTIPERSVQYSVPGWISPKLIEPLVRYLPDPQDQEEYEEIKERANVEDLSVPRAVAAPLVSRMVQFHHESQEIYRKHAGALDNAHDILAHNHDLRYGSLSSAATTLLKTPASKLPVTALYTVRKALTHAGFAFNIDRRSHRLTGYLQIRSKEQCRMVETVRDWLREWQDDMALRTALEGDEKGLRRHKTKKGAEIVYSFLDKCRTIVLKSREDREPTTCGNIGPSKKKFPITTTSDSVRTTKEDLFNDSDTELVRFIEAWCCSNMFMGLPRIEALPPLLLQATGLYEHYDLKQNTGFLFLQELGTIMPYENRVRFDQHLLLPSSQHSKPLQNLMTSLMDMANKHNFQDSMADLRHDFGDLPVFCIDDASAHEIDDGLSVETAEDGNFWVHIHIANPTAFFSRDHPLAKMARHMGESIYMPERTYMMLPRWATNRHFSLAKDRPALTFSVKMDSEGKTLEHKIQPGFLRNVLRLTHSELSAILGEEKGDGQTEMKTLTVGGEVPPARAHKSMLPEVTPEMTEQLRTLQHLSTKRSDMRLAAGGVFFDLNSPSATVYQNHKGPGLAWDHPYRKGSRTTEGDPVITLSTKGFTNWFSPTNHKTEVLVREMMLLACETAAKWCAERKVPAIFRGTIPKPDTPDAEAFLNDVLKPAAAKDPKGEYPMHLGVQYLDMLGTTALSTTPTPHKTLGMDYYGKVTSPLRRYGDMILHWQIEAALREEARTQKSLVTDNENADRSFLPFSAAVLDTIILGLQPREKIILRAKAYAEHFWVAQLLFRAFHYGECAIPDWTPVSTSPVWARPGLEKPAHLPLPMTPHLPGHVSLKAAPPAPPQNYNCHVFIQSKAGNNHWGVGCQNLELNVQCAMERPEKVGLGDARQGDVWEVSVLFVDCYRRVVFVRPVRLVERAEGGMRASPELTRHERKTLPGGAYAYAQT